MRKNRINYDSIQDAHLDHLIRLAYRQADALEARELLENAPRELSPEEEALCGRAYARFQEKARALEAEEKCRNHPQRWKRRLSRGIGIAACVVLLLGIAAPIAVARVEFIRVRVMRLLWNVQEEYTELSLVEDVDASFDVPAEWRGEYYPAYIPEGFALLEIEKRSNSAIYSNSNDVWFIFDECSKDTDSNIDTEDAVISFETIHGCEALIVEEDGTIIAWSDGTKYFILNADFSKEEALKIARSVRRIS